METDYCQECGRELIMPWEEELCDYCDNNGFSAPTEDDL